MTVSPETIDQNISLLENGELLTKIENDVFEKIKAAGNFLSQSIVSRCAGGWVRDKLLGEQSDDIDICVEGCTAVEFGQALAAQFPEGTTKTIILQENREQSKNMQTVRICIFGDKWIDICGLRGDDSATSESATPLTDAQHRDFTINALFYNITLSKVEDFVGGIPDLKNGIIRTPIDPFLTFGEDPLRIIRAARFHAKFGYEFDESIFEAAKSHVSDFESKITRERVVAELTKIIEKKGMLDFLDFINQIGFFSSVFDPYHILNIDGFEARERCRIVLSRNPSNLEESLLFGAIFYPVYGTKEQQDPEHPKKKMPIIEWAVCRALKMPLRIAEEANTLVYGAKEAISIKHDRINVGHWVRKVGSIWPYAKFLIFDESEYEKSKDLYKFIEDEKMENIYEMKPLMNGKDLAELLGIKPGKGFSTKVEELIDWQLENPNGTADDYRDYINSRK